MPPSFDDESDSERVDRGTPQIQAQAEGRGVLVIESGIVVDPKIILRSPPGLSIQLVLMERTFQELPLGGIHEILDRGAFVLATRSVALAPTRNG